MVIFEEIKNREEDMTNELGVGPTCPFCGTEGSYTNMTFWGYDELVSDLMFNCTVHGFYGLSYLRKFMVKAQEARREELKTDASLEELAEFADKEMFIDSLFKIWKEKKGLGEEQCEKRLERAFRLGILFESRPGMISRV